MGKIQGGGKKKIKVLQTLINMSHVWEVWLFHARKKSLVKKLNNCTSLPFYTIFYLDKHEQFVLSAVLVEGCNGAKSKKALFTLPWCESQQNFTLFLISCFLMISGISNHDPQTLPLKQLCHHQHMDWSRGRMRKNPKNNTTMSIRKNLCKWHCWDFILLVNFF